MKYHEIAESALRTLTKMHGNPVPYQDIIELKRRSSAPNSFLVFDKSTGKQIGSIGNRSTGYSVRSKSTGRIASRVADLKTALDYLLEYLAT